jgi:chromosome segregation ATPase
MSPIPLPVPPADVDSWPSEHGEAGGIDKTAAPAAAAETPDVKQQVLGLKKKLEEVATEFGHLQDSLASQQQLEQLLRQGRAHLQDLRGRLQQVTAERDRLDAEVTDLKTVHEREVDQLQIQIDQAANQALLQQTQAEHHQQEHRHQVETLREQLEKVTTERNRLELEMEEREAAHNRFIDERAEERCTLERLLAESTSNQRDMMQELDDQRQQLEMLREAAMRAQSLAREIMRAHELVQTEERKS